MRKALHAYARKVNSRSHRGAPASGVASAARLAMYKPPGAEEMLTLVGNHVALPCDVLDHAVDGSDLRIQG